MAISGGKCRGPMIEIKLEKFYWVIKDCVEQPTCKRVKKIPKYPWAAPMYSLSCQIYFKGIFERSLLASLYPESSIALHTCINKGSWTLEIIGLCKLWSETNVIAQLVFILPWEIAKIYIDVDTTRKLYVKWYTAVYYWVFCRSLSFWTGHRAAAVI